MKLKSIAAKNFKGLSFDEPLAPVTVLVGSNFAGKTARTDAIRLLLLGYLPELGKTARATFGLSSGTEMEVSGEFDNGLKLRRRFYLKGDTVKVDEEIPAEIADCGQLAVMLNAETYFALGPTDRVKYVFENCLLDEDLTIVAVSRKITEVLMAGGLVEKKAEVVLGQICRGMDVKNPVQAFIELALVNVALFIRDAKAHAERMEKTIQGLLGLRMADEKTGVDLPVIEVKIGKLRADVEELNLKKNALSVRYELMITGRRRRAAIESILGKFSAVSNTIHLEKNKREAILTELGKLPDSAEAIERLIEIKNAASTGYDAAERSWTAGRAVIAGLKGSIAGIDEKTACPYCGAAGDGWKAIKLAEWNTDLAKCEEILPTFAHGMKVSKESFQSSERDLEALRADRRKAESLEHDERALERSISLLEAQLAREPDLRDELAKLPIDDPQLEHDVDLIQTELNVKNEEILDCDSKRKAVMGRAAELQRLGQAETDRDAAKTDATIGGDVLKKLREIQGEMVEAAFKPLLALANSFFGDVFKSPISYHENEIGTWRAGVWITHRTMSGTEKALTYAAIQAALAARSPAKIMLIDELGRLDPANLDLLIAGAMNGVKRGAIDQFVGIDTGRADIYHAIASEDSAFQYAEIK